MHSLIRNTLDNIDSLWNYYIITLPTVEKKAKEGRKKNHIGFCIDIYFSMLVGKQIIKKEENKESLKKYVEKYVEVMEVNEEEGRVQYRIKDYETLCPNGKKKEISKMVKEYYRFAEMPILHSVNTLIMLITKFEEGISDFLSALYQLFPQKYINNQTVSFSEVEGKTPEEIKETIIAREVDELLRQKYSEWFKLFAQHKIEFSSCNEQMESLREIYARRNIWVHNSGYVNDQYISNVPNTQYNKGDTLPVDKEYLEKAFVCIKAIIYTLYLEASKICDDDKNVYVYKIFEYAFEELKNKEYILCSLVFSIIRNNKFCSEQVKYMSKINYWIAQKELGNYENIKSEIEALDTSALSEEFEMAKYILLEDYERATNIIEYIYNSKITKDELVEWPLFMKYRNSEEYSAFVEKHKEDFDVSSFALQDKDSESESDSCIESQIANS